MLRREDCELLLIENLEWAWRAMASLCSRCRMSAADADEFTSWATLKLVENDYHVIGQFRSDSTFRTYLLVVLTTLHREFRALYWGRWRPSAAARRGGKIAIDLDRLTRRDGMPLRQAALAVHTRGDCPMTLRELERLAASLPRTAKNVPDMDRFCADAIARESADDRTELADRIRDRAAIEHALRRAMDQLSSEDRSVLYMRFWDGLTVADIARRLNVPQKPLYRRINRAIRALRIALESAGITCDAAASMIDDRAA